MKFPLLVLSSALLTVSCDNHQTQSFQVIQPAAPDLSSKIQVFIPRLTRVCPGLDRYSNDLSPASVSASAMEGYEGGIELQFQVASRPQELPAPLNVRSAQNSCYISISKDGARAYIAKSACHSICEGAWQENSPDLMGREFAL